MNSKKFILKAIDIVSYPLWFYDFLKKHATIKLVVLWLSAAAILIAVNMGVAALLGAVGLVARLVLPMMFMIGQFVLLFSFLSNTKTIEIHPGDRGAYSFEKDYFGNEYLVSAVTEWVDSLTIDGRAKLDAMGAEPINGIMLEGDPGTGKTLLVQCLASAAKTSFFGMSGSDFRAMFMGVGEMKMMRVFAKARAAAPSIVFIDEMDAVGGNRGGVSGGQSGGQAAGGMFGGGIGVISKLLVELDGVKNVGRRDQMRNRMRGWFDFEPIYKGMVLTIGATNRIGAIDPALLRPGRIDKIITVDPPDNRSRKAIIVGYLGKVKHVDVDVDGLTEDTQGVTPAQLMSAIRRSAPRFALNEGRNYITQSDIDQAMQEDLVGLRNPIMDFDPEQREQVSIHEAGHGVMSWLLLPERRITHISIVRRGSGILGYMRDVGKKETYAYPLSFYENRMAVALAGHIAVDVVLKEPWSGGSSDFDHVRYYLQGMALSGQLGGIPLNPADPWANERLAQAAEDTIQDVSKHVYRLLNANRTALDTVAAAVELKGELSSVEVYAILNEFEPVTEVA